uniref:NET domain-containing protein n=1 Tax=viral metagenome TaxID=1070528 RepID=A0A6C0CSV3_9ZZZZ
MKIRDLRKYVVDKLYMNQERCKRIEMRIRNLSSTQTEELFKIFQRRKCSYTINNNGVFLNLSWLEPDILLEIEKFITFCLESKKSLDQYEAIYDDLNKNFNETILTEDIEEAIPVIDLEGINSVLITETKKILPRISSSMKYYLLKKKFSKNVTQIQLLQNKERLCKDIPVMIKNEDI